MSDSRSSTSMSIDAILLQKPLAHGSYVDSDVVGEGSEATPAVGTPNANPEYEVSGWSWSPGILGVRLGAGRRLPRRAREARLRG